MNSKNIFHSLTQIKIIIEEHKEEIEKLDQEIGDGDHIFNIQRGIKESLDLKNELSGLDPSEVLKKIGMKIMTTVGGSSGALFATLLIGMSKKYNKVLQTGSMQRSSSNFLIGCQLVRNGYLGKISQALVNVGNPASVCKLPFEETPDSIDWDKWLGSAQLRPYNKALISTSFFPRWRWYKEFGGGILADWGAHMFDIVQWGLGMDDSGPVRFVPPKEPNAW